MRRKVYDPHDDGLSEDAHEIKKLRSRISSLERDIATMQVSTESSGEPSVNRDARWHCRKCGYLLGFYDVQEDVLRTRYKEHIVYVRVGREGFVQVVCRGCSEVNTQSYTPNADENGQEASIEP